MKYIFTISVLLSLLFTSCTENPFFKDEISSADGLSFRGKVLLDDDSEPDNIYVWFPATLTGVFSNSAGDFYISLPAAQSQAGAGLSGVYPIYFYCGDYNLDSLNVLFLNGLIQYDREDLDIDGNLKTITLHKMLSTTVEVEIGEDDFTGLPFISVECVFTQLNEPCLIQFFKDYNDPDGIYNYFIWPVGSDNVILYKNVNLLVNNWIYHKTLKYYKDFLSNFALEPGEYYIYPYVHIKQKLPEGLLESLAAKSDEFSTAFLRIPYKRNPVKFIIPE